MTKSNMVGVIMFRSDYPIMSRKILNEFEIDYESTIVSAHRTPERLVEYANTI